MYILQIQANTQRGINGITFGLHSPLLDFPIRGNSAPLPKLIKPLNES